MSVATRPTRPTRPARPTGPSVSERLAVAAVRAPHRRLDDAHAIVVAAAREREAHEACVACERRRPRRAPRGRRVAAEMPRDRVADHRAELLFSHAPSPYR